MVNKIILDTNFLLTCIRQKVEFFEEIPPMGFRIVIPINVISELEILSKGKATRLADESILVLRILEGKSFEKIELPGKRVDNAIINFLKKNKNFAIATLDKDVQLKVKNPKLIIRGKKKLVLLR
jgi:rRNA-processing protein FCF1